jgi:hypothetical protein
MLLPPLFHAGHHHQFFAYPQPLGFSLGWSFSAHGFPLFAWFPSLPPFCLLQNDEPHPFLRSCLGCLPHPKDTITSLILLTVCAPTLAT